MRACTATIVEMEYLQTPVQGERYSGDVEFVDKTQWQNEVKAQLDILQTDPEEGQDDALRFAAIDSAISRLRAVYGVKHDYEKVSWKTLMAEAASCVKLGTTEHISAASAADLVTACATYIDSANDTDSGAMWPLVKRVTLRGPWGALACGATLIDAPGLHDSNTARGDVVRAEYRSADSLWLISNIKRAVNDKTIKDLLPLAFREHLVDNGVCGQVVHIATQTDVCVRSEIVTNLKLEEESTLAECVEARSKYSKQALTTAFYEGVDLAMLPTNNPDCRFALPCIAASAVDFQKLAGIRTADGAPKVFTNIESTELPALRRVIVDTAIRFATPSGQADVPVGTLLLRFEGADGKKSKDTFRCQICDADLDISEHPACEECKEQAIWDCKTCGAGDLTYVAAVDCKDAHSGGQLAIIGPGLTRSSDRVVQKTATQKAAHSKSRKKKSASSQRKRRAGAISDEENPDDEKRNAGPASPVEIERAVRQTRRGKALEPIAEDDNVPPEPAPAKKARKGKAPTKAAAAKSKNAATNSRPTRTVAKRKAGLLAERKIAENDAVDSPVKPKRARRSQRTAQKDADFEWNPEVVDLTV